MRMQSKCASYYFARQNCSACTQQYIGARGTRFNVVKSFVRKFHCSAACSPCLECMLRKQSLMKLCKNDVTWNSEKMYCNWERQHSEGSFFKLRNRRQNLLLSTNHSSVHLFSICLSQVAICEFLRRRNFAQMKISLSKLSCKYRFSIRGIDTFMTRSWLKTKCILADSKVTFSNHNLLYLIYFLN